MKCKYWYFVNILIIAIAFASCDDSVILGEFDQNEERLSVISLLRNGDRFSAIVSKTFSFSSTSINYDVEDAEISVYENDSLILLLSEPTLSETIEEPLQGVLFLSDSSMHLVDGAAYHIEVSAPNAQTAISETRIFEEVIDDNISISISFIDDGSVISINDTVRYQLNVPATGELLMEEYRALFEMQSILIGSLPPRLDLPYLLQENRVTIGIDMPAGSYENPSEAFSFSELSIEEDPYCRRITHLNPHYLRFAEAYTRQDREELGGPESLSQPVPNNIENGYGYFSVVDSRLICSD